MKSVARSPELLADWCFCRTNLKSGSLKMGAGLEDVDWGLFCRSTLALRRLCYYHLLQMFVEATVACPQPKQCCLTFSVQHVNAVIHDGISFVLFLPFLRRVLVSSYEIVDGVWDRLLPSFPNWSAVSFPVILEFDRIYWRTIFLFFFFDSLLS